MTAPDGMLGRYLLSALEQNPPTELTLFHCSGTEDDLDAEHLNLEETRELLSSLEKSVPSRIVYVSSWQVYSADGGEDVDETRPAFAWSEAGRTKAQTELLMEKWAAEHGVALTIVRPAYMFGKGVDGTMAQLFERVLANRYVHIRGNNAKMSAVTAYDAARAIVALAGNPGVFNISDGRAHEWLKLAESMVANVGLSKRMPHLPEKWAKWIYKMFKMLPVVEQMLGPAALGPMSHTLTLNNDKVREATGIEFYDTLAVIARTEKDYPYEDS